MPEPNAETKSGTLEAAVFELIRKAVRIELEAVAGFRPERNRLFTVEEVAEILSVTTDWVYRNERRLPFQKKLGPKLVRFSETGLQSWMRTLNPNRAGQS